MNKFELEKNLLKPDKWVEAPTYVQKKFADIRKEGVPMGIGYNRKIGWFVMEAGGTGQEPKLIWSQSPEPESDS